MRRPRRLREGAWYYVTARVNRREMLLDRREVRDLFLVFLSYAKKHYRFHVANFCVMGNSARDSPAKDSPRGTVTARDSHREGQSPRGTVTARDSHREGQSPIELSPRAEGVWES